MRIVGDALVSGLGADLTVNGKVVSWYASDISHEDEKILDIQEATKNVKRSLNRLTCTWKEFWCQERFHLDVRSDNIATLPEQGIKPSCQRSSLGSGRRSFQARHRHAHPWGGVV